MWAKALFIFSQKNDQAKNIFLLQIPKPRPYFQVSPKRWPGKVLFFLPSSHCNPLSFGWYFDPLISMQRGFQLLKPGSQLDSTTDHFLLLLIQQGGAEADWSKALLVRENKRKLKKSQVRPPTLAPF